MSIWLEAKKIWNNRITAITGIAFLMICFWDPILTRMKMSKGGSLGNPFEYWILINTDGYGYSVYYAFFWFIPVIMTGMILLDEQYSSVREFMICRMGRMQYYRNKILAVASSTFLFFMIALIGNLLFTYLIVPSQNEIQATWIIPTTGMFARILFDQNPLYMAVFYCIVNALIMAELALFVAANWLVFRFPNRYIAIAEPTILLVTIGHFSDLMKQYLNYSTRIIMQPLAAMGISIPITLKSYMVTLGLWLLIDVVLCIIGLLMNRDTIRK